MASPHSMVPLRLTCLHPSAYLSVLSVFKSPSYLTGLKNFQLLAPACAQKSFQHSATRGPCVRDFQAEVSQGCHVMLVSGLQLVTFSVYLFMLCMGMGAGVFESRALTWRSENDFRESVSPCGPCGSCGCNSWSALVAAVFTDDSSSCPQFCVWRQVLSVLYTMVASAGHSPLSSWDYRHPLPQPDSNLVLFREIIKKKRNNTAQGTSENTMLGDLESSLLRSYLNFFFL